MKHFALVACTALVALLGPPRAAAQPVVINEIMYHPTSQSPMDEWIEIYNPAATNVNLTGWRISGGIAYNFPPNVILGPGGYLAVAANFTRFDELHPAAGNAVGNWLTWTVTNVNGHTFTNFTPTLSNTRNSITLRDSLDNVIDSVTYADDGDWAVRRRSLALSGVRGWEWFTEADGLGKSLELVQPGLDNSSGQNWMASTVAEGTPGEPNSRLAANIAPLIINATHQPVVPKSSEPVSVTARIVDENLAGVSVALFFRTNVATPPPFVSTPMFDDGAHGDGAAADGIYGAVLSAMPNNTLIEFYIRATDSGARSRTWPAPAVDAADLGSGNLGQVANPMFQVDDSVYTGAAPLYKLIITADEIATLTTIFNNAVNSDAQVNATFISVDGDQIEHRYFAGIRNRGHGSRSGNPHNYRINVPAAAPWKGVTALNMNARTVPAQVAGAAIAQRAGVAGNDSHFAQLRVNNGAGPGGTPPNSLYAANEEPGSDWASRHFPDNDGGNYYSVYRDIAPKEFNYRGEVPASYQNTYFKGSNISEDDWRDVMGMLQVMGDNQTASWTMARARSVIDVEQWLKHLAIMSLYGNSESGINTGNNDDYAMYRGQNDPRFILVYHDLDSVLGLGSLASSSGIFGATTCCASGDTVGIANAMNFFMHHPEVEPLYYRTLQDLIDGPFSAAQFNPLVDQIFANFPEFASSATTIKNYMAARRATVAGLISGLVPLATNSPIAIISGEPRNPTFATSATLTVGGADITHYRYKLNNGAYGAETPVATPISLSGLANGSTNTVYVVGRNAGGIYQSTATPTISKAWVVNTAWPTVRLSEVFAQNDSAFNHSGTFPDAVELHNEGAAAVDLSGMTLTDDPLVPARFTIPDGTTLNAGAYLTLLANNPDGTPGIHLGFSLGAGGDAVYLFHRAGSGGALLDSVKFGLQLPNLSIGRLGSSGDWSLSQPTIGAANVAQSVGPASALRINEFFANSEPPTTEDFVELYNPGALPVAVGGLYLTDSPLGRVKQHRIADLSFINVAGFTAFVADGRGGAGAEHLNFRLTSDVGSIVLADYRAAFIDYVTYGPQRVGVSMGRCPDGGATNVVLGIRTPGAPNYCPAPPPTAPPPVMVNLLNLTNVWRYFTNGVEPAPNWTAAGYDDSAWNGEGPAPLGRLRNGGVIPEVIQTPLPAIPLTSGKMTFYFRTRINMVSVPAFTSLQISNLIDDGAVFYINGIEVARFNMNSGTVASNTAAAGAITDASWQNPTTTTLNLTNLRAGENVIAVEVHQAASGTAGDNVFAMKLDGLIVTNVVAVGGLVINEVLADNAGSLTVDGRTPDWIELYNPTTSSVDVGGMSLNDQANNNPPRWVFPAGSIVPARGYLVVYADVDLPVSSTNTGFGLKANGGEVYLFNKAPSTNEIIDRISYGLQTPDLSVGRVPVGSANLALTLPTPGATNVAAVLGNVSLLRINEWMADPASGDDWFELYNADTRPVALGGLRLTDTFGTPDSYRIPDLSFIGVGSNAFVRFEADNPSTPAGPEHVNFKLGKDGDSIFLLAANNGTQIDAVSFGPQITGVSQGRLPDGAAAIVFFPETPTPKDANFLPLANVVVNEVLSHTDLPLEDAIELRNTTGQPIDISGWWLSDANETPRKYQIPANTILSAGGFKVFYEVNFNNTDNGIPFSLNSAKGDQVYLSQAAGGALTGYRAVAKFGPSANGVSFGRYMNTIGDVDYTALSALSFGTGVTAQSPANQISLFRTGAGAANAYPKVGPIVITEVMYHPPDVGTNDNTIEEFIELRNTSAGTVVLYDPVYPTNGWKLRDAVDFHFNSSHSIPAGGSMILVSFDPVTNITALAQFRAKYGTNLFLVGPYSGKLDNSTESVELARPDAPQTIGNDAGLVPYILVDKVLYQDRGAWPTNADGHGMSLQRVSVSGYGNEPTNWIAAAPAPDQITAASLDSDGDGMPDGWEDQYGFNKNSSADAALDFDGDGMTNREEYLAGTHPKQAGSALLLTATKNGAVTELRFNAVTDKTYTILYSPTLDLPIGWQRLVDVPAQVANQSVMVPDGSVASGSQRFYRIVTPAIP